MRLPLRASCVRVLPLLVALSASPAGGLSASRSSRQGLANDYSLTQQAFANAWVALQGLQIGSFSGGADVAAGGRVQPGWLKGSPASIAPTEVRTRLWAQVPLSAAGISLPLQQVAVASDNPSVATAFVRASSTVIGTFLQPFVSDVIYQCHRAGTVGMTASLIFPYSWLAPVQLNLAKVCSARARTGLCLGTSLEQLDDVVHNGVSRWTAPTAWQRLLPSGTQRITLFLALRSSSSSDDSTAQDVARPRVLVTSLAGRSHGVDWATLVHCWQQQLLEHEGKEKTWQRAGSWGLLKPDRTARGAWGSNASGCAALPRPRRVLRVHVTGPFSKGGTLHKTTGRSPPSPLEVELECLSQGAALVEIEVASLPAYQPYRPAVFSFVKLCGDMKDEGFDLAALPFGQLQQSGQQAMSLLSGGGSSISDGASPPVGYIVHDGALTGQLPTVGNIQDATVVHWRSRRSNLGHPDASRLDCSSDIVKAWLVPPKDRRVGGRGALGSLEMRFACARPGVARCTLQFGWRLHKGPTMRFKKVCGGRRSDVRIESDWPGASLVLQKGLTLPSWLSQSWLSQTLVELPPDEDRLMFTISLDKELQPGEQTLKLLHPNIRLSNPYMLEAIVSSDIVDGKEIRTKIDGAEMEVGLRCRDVGTSQVAITLPYAGSASLFKPLSFTFAKRCDRAHVTGGPPTAGIVLGTFSLLFVSSFMAIMMCIRSSQAKIDRERADRELLGPGEAYDIADDPFLNSGRLKAHERTLPGSGAPWDGGGVYGPSAHSPPPSGDY